MHSAAFREALASGDFRRMRAVWQLLFPHLGPLPAERAEEVLHVARTEAESMQDRARVYSHCWLRERGLPSRLPDRLRPIADRVYARVVEAVGIAVVARTPEGVDRAAAVERAMAEVAAEMYADGDTDPVLVKARMFDRAAAVRASF